jgi:signal peptidase I
MSEFETRSAQPRDMNGFAPAEARDPNTDPLSTENAADDTYGTGSNEPEAEESRYAAADVTGESTEAASSAEPAFTADGNTSTVEVAESPAGPASDTPTHEPVGPIRRSSGVGSFFGTMQSLAITVVIAVFVITFVVQAFQIPSESMENTLLIGDYLLVDKIHYGPHGLWGHVEPYEPIRRGDIIVFHYPVNPTQHFVKRVIGVPGDRVRLINKRVYINGQPQAERYVVYSRPFSEYPDNFPVPGMIDPNMEMSWFIQLRKLVEGRELIVPENSYFVLGDNRDKSLDSRYWGFVPRENVVGRPLIIYFSMRRPIEVTTPLSSFSDKLHDLTYNLTDLSGRIRWRRAFRLIK